MASIKEIRSHIKSVEQTLKITNAMYLISSSNMRKARKQLSEVEPYFQKISGTIADILHHSPEVHHRFFDLRPSIPPEQRKIGYIVITGDKGLAGAYNHNVLKLAEDRLAQHPNSTLFVIGQVGRSYFMERGISVDGEFLYTAQNPTTYRAREITNTMVKLFEDGHLDEVHIIFTRMITTLHLEPTEWKLLPLAKETFSYQKWNESGYRHEVSYVPSVTDVMNRLVPGYVKGTIFGALVESYCSEQSARMTAMDSSTKNAREMLRTLSLSYNQARQAAITQEITEIVGGAAASQGPTEVPIIF